MSTRTMRHHQDHAATAPAAGTHRLPLDAVLRGIAGAPTDGEPTDRLVTAIASQLPATIDLPTDAVVDWMSRVCDAPRLLAVRPHIPDALFPAAFAASIGADDASAFARRFFPLVESFAARLPDGSLAADDEAAMWTHTYTHPEVLDRLSGEAPHTVRRAAQLIRGRGNAAELMFFQDTVASADSPARRILDAGLTGIHQAGPAADLPGPHRVGIIAHWVTQVGVQLEYQAPKRIDPSDAASEAERAQEIASERQTITRLFTAAWDACAPADQQALEACPRVALAQLRLHPERMTPRSLLSLAIVGWRDANGADGALTRLLGGYRRADWHWNPDRDYLPALERMPPGGLGSTRLRRVLADPIGAGDTASILAWYRGCDPCWRDELIRRATDAFVGDDDDRRAPAAALLAGLGQGAS